MAAWTSRRRYAWTTRSLRLARYIPLAPPRQPHNRAPIRLLLAGHPEPCQVAGCDIAFHRSPPELAQAFALTTEIPQHGVRRHGFHGLSREYSAVNWRLKTSHAVALKTSRDTDVYRDRTEQIGVCCGPWAFSGP